MLVFFQRILIILPPLPQQYWAAIGFSENWEPIGVTVHSRYVENFIAAICRRGIGCRGLGNTIFPEHPVISIMAAIKIRAHLTIFIGYLFFD